MPVHSTTLSVRYDECDAYSHVNHANYIRYMAFAAHKAADWVVETSGVEPQGYWLVREHNIDYLKPLHFGDEVTIETWVADFNRMRSLRMYRFLNQHGDEVAKASSDWVYLDAEKQQIATVPEALREAFERHNTAPDREFPGRDRFPKQPPLPEMPFTNRQLVDWRDVDPQKHVNNAAYFAYNENAIFKLCEAVGWDNARLEERGIAIIARNYRMEYKTPAVMGDELDVTTWATDMRRSTAKRHYAIHRVSDGALICRSTAYYVWINTFKQSIMRIPPDFREAFESNITVLPPKA